jgi:hypothetical protein
MATTNPTRISDKEVQARAKMAAFIDRVIDTIESTPREKKAEDRPKVNRRRVASPTTD